MQHKESTLIQHTLQALRYKLFARPEYITTESRKPILNMAMTMQQRAWMQGFWEQAISFDLPATSHQLRLLEGFMENLG